MLTLLVNGIVRPFNEHAANDLRRVDTWLRVIDILATSSERADLLQKKEFLAHMRDWTRHVIEDGLSGIETECFAGQCRAYLDSADETTRDDVTTGLPGLGDYDPDVFPLDRLYVGHPAENWAHQTSSAWPFSTVTFT